MKKCSWLSRLTWILVVIGSLNWGLVGLGNFFDSNWNVISLIFGGWPSVEGLIYILVGISGVLFISGYHCKTCNDSSKKNTPMPETPPQQM